MACLFLWFSLPGGKVVKREREPPYLFFPIEFISVRNTCQLPATGILPYIQNAGSLLGIRRDA
jgi:hypothetical protein